jgi:hypothetical protein
VFSTHLRSGHTKSCGCLTQRLQRIRRQSPNVMTIPLVCGGTAIIDRDDHWLTVSYAWRRNLRSGYAFATLKDGKTIYLHRHLLGLTDPKEPADHRDGDRLNCTRKNLRAVDWSINAQNRHGVRSESGYQGVSTAGSRWRVEFMHLGQRHYGGVHDSAEEAARVYDRLVTELRGPEARTNFPAKATACPRSTPRSSPR